MQTTYNISYKSLAYYVLQIWSWKWTPSYVRDSYVRNTTFNSLIKLHTIN